MKTQLLNYEQIVKVQNKGLITIPKRIRDEFDLKEESLIRVKKDKSRIILEPVRILPYQMRTYTKPGLKDFFDLDKRESFELKKKWWII